jgi:nucleoside 2-deoxyribosyltransferase
MPRDIDVVWLTEIERRLEHGLPLDNREMMVALRDQLPRGFKPSDVDGRLLYGAAGPSIEGLRLLGDHLRILPDVERTIRHIRDRLIEYPSLAKVTAAEIAQALDLPVNRAERVLVLISSVGGFISGATGSSNGYAEIGLGRDEIVADYLGFESLEKLLAGRSEPVQAHRPPSVRRRSREESQHTASDTAFILMNMDPQDDMLADVSNTIKEECSAFGVKALRIDDVEHQDTITDRILSLIKESDLIIADLSGERPNVYYEVGYAHAIGKRPILYRRKGTRLHFDLSVHNVPEYKNLSELRSVLHKRLEAMLGRSAGQRQSPPSGARAT